MPVTRESGGMTCTCGGASIVIETRNSGNRRRRRHECQKCQKRFTTYEISAEEIEKLKAVKVNEAEIDSVIETLRALKVRFGGSNGHR
jgi:transcriptional regulator NrdR family protein